jgi:hypothetical protein
MAQSGARASRAIFSASAAVKREEEYRAAERKARKPGIKTNRFHSDEKKLFGGMIELEAP